MNQNEQNFLDQAEAAFLLFAERFPDYDQCEASARLMAAGLREAGLSPTSSDHLAAVWLKIRPSVPAPEPVAESTDTPLDALAKELIASGKVSVDSVRALSAKEFEQHMQYPAWERAVELLPRPAPSPLTRGELVAATGRAN